VVGERPCLDPGSAHGFAVDEAEGTFWGLCPDCQAKRAEETGRAEERPPERRI
jgi:Fur family transcriptional regulator, stress-responsive regulator